MFFLDGICFHSVLVRLGYEGMPKVHRNMLSSSGADAATVPDETRNSDFGTNFSGIVTVAFCQGIRRYQQEHIVNHCQCRFGISSDND